mgnify:CR=1 FL=1
MEADCSQAHQTGNAIALNGDAIALNGNAIILNGSAGEGWGGVGAEGGHIPMDARGIVGQPEGRPSTHWIPLDPMGYPHTT